MGAAQEERMYHLFTKVGRAHHVLLFLRAEQMIANCSVSTHNQRPKGTPSVHACTVGLCANLTSTMESNRPETMRLAWAVLRSCSSARDATISPFKTTSSLRTGVLVEKEEVAVAAPTEPHGLAVRAQAAAAAVVRVAARRSMVSDQYQSMLRF